MSVRPAPNEEPGYYDGPPPAEWEDQAPDDLDPPPSLHLVRPSTPTPDGVAAKAALIRAAMLTTEQMKALPPPQPLVDGYLNLDSLAEIYAPSGTGKSFLALDLAQHIARGAWWQGRAVTGGPVVYVVAEGASGFGPRSTSWEKHSRMHREVHPIHWIPMAINIFDTEWTAALVSELADLRPSLVVIDTLARSIVGAEENSAKDMGRVVDNLDAIRTATGACVLIVHHTGKEAGRGARGNSALQGALDTELELSGDADRLTLRMTKQKDGPELPPLHLALVAVEGTDSCAITSAREAPPGELPAPVAETLAALVEIDVPEGLAATAWKAAADKPDRTFYRHRAGLLEQGLVVNVGTDKTPRYRAASATGTATATPLERGGWLAVVHPAPSRQCHGSAMAVDPQANRPPNPHQGEPPP